MDVTHYIFFGNLRDVHVIVDICLGFMYALALPGEKDANVIKVLKSAILVMGVPWAIKTDNDPAYVSQKFNNFVSPWKMFHITGILYNPQGQVTVEQTNRILKELLVKNNLSQKPRNIQTWPRWKIFFILIFSVLMISD